MSKAEHTPSLNAYGEADDSTDWYSGPQLEEIVRAKTEDARLATQHALGWMDAHEWGKALLRLNAARASLLSALNASVADHKQARANAAHIDRAVNSHEALVEALRKARGFVKEIHDLDKEAWGAGDPHYAEVLAGIDAALSAATPTGRR